MRQTTPLTNRLSLALIALVVCSALLLVLAPRAAALPAPVSDAWLLGFYPTEQNAEIDYNFSHELSQAFLPDLPAERAALVWRVLSPDPLPPRDMQISYNQRLLATLPINSQARVVRTLLPTVGEEATDGLTIEFASPAVTPAGEMRSVGMLFDYIRVRRLSRVDWWPPLLWGLIALLGLGVGLSLYTLRQSLYCWWQRLRQSRAAVYKHLIVLIGLSYAVGMAAISLVKHQVFRSYSFDLGIYDQVLWLISHGLYPYSTVMGLHTLGNHAAFILFPLALIYTFLPDVRVLLVLQSIVVALGVIPIYAIAQRYKQPLLGIAVALVYLLHSATLNMTLFDFHPDTFAATAFLFALWLAEGRRWWPLFVSCFIVLLCKENFSLTVAMLGFWLVLQRRWPRGLALLALGLAWFAISTQLVEPYFNGLGRAYHLERYRQYGGNMQTIIAQFLDNPLLLAQIVFQPKQLLYVLQLIAPFAGLCLLGWRRLLIAGPAVLLNMLSIFDGQITMGYHYQALILAVVAVASLDGLATLSRMRWATAGRRLQRLRLGLVLGMIAGLLFVRLTANVAFNVILSALGSDRNQYYEYALSLIPPDAAISSQTIIQPHLAQRLQTYLFPTPFYNTSLVNEQQMPFPARVDCILLDTKRLGDFPLEHQQQLDILQNIKDTHEYTLVVDLDGVILLRRNGYAE